MKYEQQLVNLKDQVYQAKKILIVSPAKITVDRLAAALSLMLSLKQQGKDVTVLTEGSPLVSHSHLFGVGKIKKEFPQSEGGNFIVSLEGVVDTSSGTPIVTALEKLDWYPEGNNLNLVFHVVPGAQFSPTNITTRTQGQGFDVIFMIGAANPFDLGGIYQNHLDEFSEALTVNIDNNSQNSSFGKINIIDQHASSLSEMISHIIPDLGLGVDQDIATNIIAGIYDTTRQMTHRVTPETFMAIAQAMQLGGKIPQQQSHQGQGKPQFQQNQGGTQKQQGQQNQGKGFDLSKMFNQKYEPKQNNQPQQPQEQQQSQQNQPQPSQKKSEEETPSGEVVATRSAENGEFVTRQNVENNTPAPDWLTPKIYKGGSLG